MAASKVEQIPLVDAEGFIAGLQVLTDPLGDQPVQDNWVVLMAGGLGQRLRPMTEKTPKPLLPINGKPLLEIILERFLMQNFHKFYISVNYKSEQITEHFGDGSQWGVEIRYLHEEKPLGTAGGLGLIKETPKLPLIIMNGDLLTKVDFRQLLNFHRQQDCAGTLAVQPYEMRVPFGVVDIEGGQVRKIDEKPASSFFVNAGIYIVEPEVLKSVNENEYLDSPDLFTRLAESGKRIVAFPLMEYWLDVGRMDDFERANAEFKKEFQ
jgi:NDP-sugar pyrophosphorylase family protein